ncbi:GRIP and coiled-coil domain-containing protein 1 [Condylostylus longicornis]|uniref:GRIP and coiled-coil domain-containing protein 1 n=1 Tax=Condylostylus longicornis TaxID=2530218 RepID=UPI00244E170E|nr:GRIP and coiled-coil domain-containing protein 1 [Condylostylus longicornis]
MDKSKAELESLVKSQKEQLSRYEARLKDVVTAYKGLLKEKEALELSLSALNKAKESPAFDNNEAADNISVSSDTSTENALNKGEKSNLESPLRKVSQVDLQSQIATLMHSLATLSAEKSRMEASFQADKKKLRSELSKKDELNSRLEEKVKELEKKIITDKDNMKSKIIVERHEREKESNDHMVMLRELQKLLSDERHLKENLEMQLNNLKAEISSNFGYNSGNKLKELANELKQAKEQLKKYEENDIGQKSFQENTIIMQQLQKEMQHLKQQHATAIKAEQKRALLAEEHSKRLSALHEDRVANLEARLAELSNTVGTYDRLRQQDQENIQKLKEKISKFGTSSIDSTDQGPDPSILRKRDAQSIFDEIMKLKKVLIIENAKSQNPVDLNKIFNSAGNDHSQCLEDYRKIREELEHFKAENSTLIQVSNGQKQNIKTLQEKITVLNQNIEEQENDLKLQNERLIQAVKTEKSKWKISLTTAENEYRSKISELEQQLQKQRVRSLQLLDEKENEIKALKTSFELIVKQSSSSTDFDPYESCGATSTTSTAAAHVQNILSSQSAVSAATAANPNLNLENCHMLHYANEIARKDVEIAGLRKAKYSAETALRQALQDKVTTQEELHDKISALEIEVDRLERCKTREGANLEYLKNVFISFLSTSSQDGKRHMINAISTILQFTPAESEAINSILFNKRTQISRRISLSK